MPTTTTERGYIISVKQSGGTSAQTSIVFRNRRTEKIVRVQTVTNEAKTNLANTKEWPDGFQNGDVIDITGSGIKTGNATHTVDRIKGGVSIALIMVDVTTTNAPAVVIG